MRSKRKRKRRRRKKIRRRRKRRKRIRGSYDKEAMNFLKKNEIRPLQQYEPCD